MRIMIVLLFYTPKTKDSLMLQYKKSCKDRRISTSLTTSLTGPGYLTQLYFLYWRTEENTQIHCLNSISYKFFNAQQWNGVRDILV